MGTPPENEDNDSGEILLGIKRMLVAVRRGEWILRTAAGFVLAVVFICLPFTELGAGEPWYFWVGSGVIAFIAGSLLTWLLVTVYWKDGA
jgi:hypothetical protein